MRRRRAFQLAGGLTLTAWVATVVVAGLVALAGVAGLVGWTDYHYRISLLPGTHLLDLAYQPSWGVLQGGEVCERVNIAKPELDCYNVVLHQGGQKLDGDVWLQGNVRPVRADLEGRLLLDADPGWNSLIASLYAMTVLGVLVLAFLLFQLWLLLRAATRAEPFTDHVVRRLRMLGWTLVGWEFAEPFLWLFGSPKAHDYSLASVGAWPGLQLASMEPGGPQLTLIAFGLMLVLLAEVFRYGAHLEHEQRLTV